MKGFGQILSQVYMCIDQQDSMVHCPSCSKECDMDQPIYYQPNHPEEELKEQEILNVIYVWRQKYSQKSCILKGLFSIGMNLCQMAHSPK